MSSLRILYLLLTVMGAVVPMYHLVGWFQINGFDVPGLIEAWLANPAVAGLAWDLAIAALVLSVFIVAEVSVRRDWWVMVCIPATCCVGVSFGLPLYLLLRTRSLR